jgi:hypothetical protein
MIKRSGSRAGSGSIRQTNGSGSETLAIPIFILYFLFLPGVRDEHVLLHEAVERRLRLGAQLDQKCGHLSLPPPPHTHPPGPTLGSCHRRLQVQCSQLLENNNVCKLHVCTGIELAR